MTDTRNASNYKSRMLLRPQSNGTVGYGELNAQRTQSYSSPTGKLSPLTTNPPCQLNVLGHDGHVLGVDGAQVGVLEETHQVGLCCLLQSKHSMALEAKISLHGSSRKTTQNSSQTNSTNTRWVMCKQDI